MTNQPAQEHAKISPFGHTYWMCNCIEAFERLAYFGIRAVAPIYIMQATEPGGLHLTAVDKGWIYAWWAIFQSWLPMITGGLADRYGYKRILFCAVTANVIGYVMMAFLHSYYGFFAGILVLATGTAFFKPALQGSIAQNLTKANSSMGWGIFYWVVNVGAFGAPLLATVILGVPHSAEGWRNLFLASAAYTSVNLLLLFTFKDVPSGADKSLGLGVVFSRTIENIWPWWFTGGKLDPLRWIPGTIMVAAGLAVLILKPVDNEWLGLALGWGLFFAGMILIVWLRDGRFTWQLRLPAFLLIMSCFWMMMYQLWDLHPNFIEDWVDSSSVAEYSPFEGWVDYGDRGQPRVQQQILLNLNALLIIILVMPLSWLVRKMRTLEAMLIGMSVATVGILVAGLTGNGWILLLGIVFFSLGEMLTGPKKNEYLGLIAPPGKKGLYLGYVNIPVGFGVGLGSIIAGHVYDNYGEKASLALKEMGTDSALVARAARAADWSDTLHLIPELLDIDRSNALDIAAQDMGSVRATAAHTLLDAFRSDQGQITNLGLVYLALSDEFKGKAASGLSEQLTARNATVDTIGIARFIDKLPDAIGLKRPQVFEIIRDRVNRDLPPEKINGDSAIVDMLWDRFTGDTETLNNLALEYLAQGTARIEEVVAPMTFDNPVVDIDKRLGLGRTKAFAAMASAMGANDAEVRQALSEYATPTDDENASVYNYLIAQKHQRFTAVARKDWKMDLAFLKEVVESDAAAMAVVNEGIEPGDDPLIERLAGDHDLIQKALDAKDWSKTPHHAASLLRLNPYEARSLAAAEVNRAAVTATKLLWEKYNPQYLVWCPFAAIGILATVALYIFGQMAKRWSDMNA